MDVWINRDAYNSQMVANMYTKKAFSQLTVDNFDQEVSKVWSVLFVSKYSFTV